ncbi:hypothetical protein GGTG_11796 [Gaeumannomyces tritici R3-111a-1]|uniref:Heterokaryon incompatibility domain-containing protein n=1 Tax=Gaeumannomyces tritici (strain R3-111a-1) TaxID=644352 RepID=J3PE73_GAET3|nr:hypothetical protein GGTG_11796 [Gaeumannomyces tritici R3-111a-1]EJT70773.1 hypothetical protein GGTG_11796 [Gaeumannomyces tritici R3-111a-1]
MDDPGPGCHPVCYRPLAAQCIRVLELEPGDFSAPIVGRLVSQTIDGEPYEALSYVWGDTKNRRDITIDGGTLSVTWSLHSALTAFRHLPPPGNQGSSSSAPRRQGRPGVRRLWADAVCINQEDLPERTSQVELMARVFASARRVLAWLGWEEGEEGRRHTRDAIRFVHYFMEDPEGRLRDARVLLEHDAVDPDDATGAAAARLAALPRRDRRRYQQQARWWYAIKFFFDIQYFHRTWIVQELGLAREAILYTALWPTGAADGGGSKALELDSVDWPLLGRFVHFMDFNAASLVTHLDMLLWVAHHILMIWELNEDGSPKCDFLTSMHWARILGVTDARDRVYSLLGHPLATIDGQTVIRPDYTVTRGLVYTKLALAFIRKAGSLYALSLVDHEHDPPLEARDWDPRDEGRMPSWAPDWHSVNRTTPFAYPVPAAEEHDAGIRIDGGVDGVEGTPLPRLFLRGWIIGRVSAVSRRMETTDFPVTHLERERAKKNPFWLDRVWALVRPAGPDNDNDDDALAVLESLSLALPLGTREKHETMTGIGPQQAREDHERSFAAYVLEYHELLRSAPEPAAAGSRDGDGDGYLPARSLLDSLPAEAQRELRRRARGGATGTRFVECMTWPSMCRVVYRTASGLVGMGSRVTRPGDLVCRVRGSEVMMTLRPVGGADADTAPIPCAHIGPTIVPARMKAGTVDGSEFGERAASFCII